MTSIQECNRVFQELWDSASYYVSNSLVFLDDVSAECAHWTSGTGKLFAAGASNIKKFSSFEAGGPYDSRAVIIVSDLLAGTVEQIICDILSSSYFENCTVITSIPHSLHKHLLTSNENVQQGVSEVDHNSLFKEFEGKMLQWMRKQTSPHAAEVIHIPLTVASVNSNLFYLPAFNNLFPLLKSDLSRIDMTDVNNTTSSSPSQEPRLDQLPENFKTAIKKLVSCLSSMCENLSLNEDIYCMGRTSRVVASELAGLLSARARRKAAKSRASLILIDRTLDLVGPCGHNHDSFLDKVLSMLPPLPGHMTDVTVDMTDFYGLTSIPGQQVLVPGCLSHPASSEAQEILSKMMMEKKNTEVLRALNRHLVEAKARLSDGSAITKVSRITVDSLNDHLQVFKNNAESLIGHSDLIQLTTACIQTLKNENLKRHEDLAGEEKCLLQGLDSNLETQVWDEIDSFLSKEATNESRVYSVEEVLKRLLYLASLTGSELKWAAADKERIKSHLVKIFTKNAGNSTYVREATNDDPTEENIIKVVNSIVLKLSSVTSCRDNLQTMSSVLDIGTIQKPTSYLPLLQQLLTKIFDPSKPELVDLEYKSSGLRDLLKSSFSYFMNVSKPRPNDHPLMIIFVIGGVTCSEVKMITDVVSAKSSQTQILVGGTQILKHSNLLHSLFCTDQLAPS